jgi:hypothetical protein
MTQKIRIEPDPTDLLSFLDESGYPYREWLEHEWLKDCAIFARVNDEFGTVGFIWAQWEDVGSLIVHVASLPMAKFDWRGLMSDLDTVAYFLGADEMVLSFDLNKRARSLGRLVESVGFVRDPENEMADKARYRRPIHG